MFAEEKLEKIKNVGKREEAKNITTKFKYSQ